MMTTEYTMAVEWQCRDIHAWVECDLDKIDPQKNEKKFLYRSKVLPYVTNPIADTLHTQYNSMVSGKLLHFRI